MPINAQCYAIRRFMTTISVVTSYIVSFERRETESQRLTYPCDIGNVESLREYYQS